MQTVRTELDEYLGQTMRDNATVAYFASKRARENILAKKRGE